MSEKKTYYMPSTPENPIVFGPNEPVDFDRFAAAMGEDGCVLGFEATGLVVSKNAHLVPQRFKERDPKVVKHMEESERQRAAAKKKMKKAPSRINATTLEAKISKDGIPDLRETVSAELGRLRKSTRGAEIRLSKVVEKAEARKNNSINKPIRSRKKSNRAKPRRNKR